MTEELIEIEEDREVTAKLSVGDIVRGFVEREPRLPNCVPAIKFGAKTDLGRIRENNEDKFDFFEVEEPTLLAVRGCLYAVADGMGGHAAGQIASEMALKTLVTTYYNSPNEDIATSLLESIQAANAAVFGVSQMVAERAGMGTTLTVAVIAEDRVYIGQVGDSRAYLIRDGEIRQVTHDHSWVAEQVRAGVLTEVDAETSPYRNVITRSIGNQETVEPDVFIEEVHIGDVWVLCSDGLTGHVNADEIRSIGSTQSPTEIARQLIELANSRGGRDNITVFAISIRDLWRSNVGDPSNLEVNPPTETPINSQTDTTSDAKRGIKRLFGR